MSLSLSFMLQRPENHLLINLLETVMTRTAQKLAATWGMPVLLCFCTLHQIIHRRTRDALAICVGVTPFSSGLQFSTTLLQGLVVFICMENEFLHEIVIVFKSSPTFLHFLEL
jgi:hypothetical protein